MKDELIKLMYESSSRKAGLKPLFLNHDVIIWQERCGFNSRASSKNTYNENPKFFQSYIDVSSDSDYVWTISQTVSLPEAELDLELPWDRNGQLIIEENKAFIICEEYESYTGIIFSRNLAGESDLIERLRLLVQAFEFGFEQGQKKGEAMLRKNIQELIFKESD